MLDHERSLSRSAGSARRLIKNNAYVGCSNVAVHLMVTVKYTAYSNNPHTIDNLKNALTEYIRNVDRNILNTVPFDIVQHVNKCLEIGVVRFEHYL
jgi:hypothetical protein